MVQFVIIQYYTHYTIIITYLGHGRQVLVYLAHDKVIAKEQDLPMMTRSLMFSVWAYKVTLTALEEYSLHLRGMFGQQGLYLEACVSLFS